MSGVEGADEVAAELLALGVKAGARAYATTRFHGALLEAEVKRNASLPRTAARAGDAHGARLGAAAQSPGASGFALAGQLANQLSRGGLGTSGGWQGVRLITGNYVRTINLQMSVLGGGPTASVGTNAPQGRRLELGFAETDSRGRSYSQPPYPHFGPAMAKIEPLFVAAIAALAVPER